MYRCNEEHHLCLQVRCGSMVRLDGLRIFSEYRRSVSALTGDLHAMVKGPNSSIGGTAGALLRVLKSGLVTDLLTGRVRVPVDIGG
jgi:hypothetical protein